MRIEARVEDVDPCRPLPRRGHVCCGALLVCGCRFHSDGDGSRRGSRVLAPRRPDPSRSRRLTRTLRNVKHTDGYRAGVVRGVGLPRPFSLTLPWSRASSRTAPPGVAPRVAAGAAAPGFRASLPANLATDALATDALAVGALAVGALAVDALAVGSLAAGNTTRAAATLALDLLKRTGVRADATFPGLVEAVARSAAGAQDKTALVLKGDRHAFSARHGGGSGREGRL